MGAKKLNLFDNGEKCMVCGNEKNLGIHIIDQFICEACETEIVHTDVEDPKYAEYLSKLSILNIKKYHTVKSGHS